MNKKKVVIIDDSAMMREILSEMINNFEEYEVVATAADPHIGADKIMKHLPDIITLDVEMPKMDGLTFLEKLMRLRPMPVLIISSLTQRNSDLALKALELGALDYVTKPTRAIKDSMDEISAQIKEKLDAGVLSKVKRLETTKLEVEKKYSTDAVIEKSKHIKFMTTDKVIAIGASTGGTVALARLLQKLPTDIPGIVIVQHMPAGFTKSFAQRLDRECELYVKEAQDNDTILSGQVLIAPGDIHMVMKRSGTRYYVNLLKGEPVNRHRPAVDVLFRSAAQSAGPNAIGVILTGMGDDGARGLLEMREVGCETIAQDEASSTVFGMPKVAIDMGAANKIMPLDKIGGVLMKHRNS